MQKTLALIEKGKQLIAKGRELLARARKAAIPAVAALGLIVGTDSPTYVNVTVILVALGVFTIPNARKR